MLIIYCLFKNIRIIKITHFFYLFLVYIHIFIILNIIHVKTDIFLELKICFDDFLNDVFIIVIQ